MRRGLPPELLVILAGVTAALHVGKLPPALPLLREALGVSLVQAGFLLSLVQLAGMSLGLLLGLMADGIGLRRSVLAGLAILAAASALGGFAGSPEALL
ncbi:MAG TPA: MFS transporter, partial [Burkholderiaceae bacterium]|nr:MFS transporter [Burkholderiaceae bacterium]